jgi:hypothetical protein
MALNVKEVSIIREPDDRLATVRVSLGSASLRLGEDGIYLVFRGDPAAVVELLETAAELARQKLPNGRYQDRRGRPQG